MMTLAVIIIIVVNEREQDVCISVKSVYFVYSTYCGFSVVDAKPMLRKWEKPCNNMILLQI